MSESKLSESEKRAERANDLAYWRNVLIWFAICTIGPSSCSIAAKLDKIATAIEQIRP